MLSAPQPFPTVSFALPVPARGHSGLSDFGLGNSDLGGRYSSSLIPGLQPFPPTGVLNSPVHFFDRSGQFCSVMDSHPSNSSAAWGRTMRFMKANTAQPEPTHPHKGCPGCVPRSLPGRGLESQCPRPLPRLPPTPDRPTQSANAPMTIFDGAVIRSPLA